MRIEIKAYGRGKEISISKAVGELRLRADGDDDAEYLKVLSDMVRHPDLLAVLLHIGKATLEKRITEKDKRQIVDIAERAIKTSKDAMP